jgi:hypothetical protein
MSSSSEPSTEEEEYHDDCDVVDEEPPVKKRIWQCPNDKCCAIFNSERTYYRHKRLGCTDHLTDRRLAINKSTVSSQHAPPEEQAVDADAQHEHPSLEQLDQPQSPQSMNSLDLQQPQSPASPSIDMHPPASIHSASPAGSLGRPPDVNPQFNGRLHDDPPSSSSDEEGEESDDYDEFFKPESLQMQDLESEGDNVEPQSAFNDYGNMEGCVSGDEDGPQEEEFVFDDSKRRVYGTAGGGIRRTADWYVEHKGEPLYEGCTHLTIESASYALLRAKLDHRLTDEYVEEHCRFMSHVVLPAGNHHPPSLHLLKKICGVDELQKYEKHVCVNDCVRFADVPAPPARLDAEEKCPKCKTSRFVAGPKAGSHMVPRKVFYEIQVEQAIAGLFGDPEWNERRFNSRFDQALDYYSSPEARRLDAATGYALFKRDTSAYEIGFDFFQCFNFKQHSVGIVGMRCAFVGGL